MSVAIVVGNPKPRSRTFQAARLVAERLTGHAPDLDIDLVDLGAALLDWDDAGVARAVADVQSAELVVFASPTYKATYTGLLKLFLDRFAAGALGGAVAIPLMLGGNWRHALAPEIFLKPVLNEIGGATPTPALFLPDTEYAGGETLTAWLDLARPRLGALAGAA